MKTVLASHAVDLATYYHMAMNMVSTRSFFHAMLTPRQVLKKYLIACQNCDVDLHNEHWLKEAWLVVEELEAKQKVAMQRLLRPNAVATKEV